MKQTKENLLPKFFLAIFCLLLLCSFSFSCPIELGAAAPPGKSFTGVFRTKLAKLLRLRLFNKKSFSLFSSFFRIPHRQKGLSRREDCRKHSHDEHCAILPNFFDPSVNFYDAGSLAALEERGALEVPAVQYHRT
jgi:hypothetical protein